MNQLGTVYATKRRRRNGKSLKPPPKDGVTKSNPSKRHRERLNAELDTLANLLPFEQNILSKLDRLSILRLSVSYLRTKSYFQVTMHKEKEEGGHGHGQYHRGRGDLSVYDHSLLDGDMFLQALNGFLLMLTCEGEVFFATHTIESYLGFHQSDIVHQSVYELVHSEDREELQRQLMWNSFLPTESQGLGLQEALQPDRAQLLERSFTVRFRCLLDNTSGFLRLDIRGRIKVLHGQNRKTEDPPLALFALCTPFGPPSLLEIPHKEVMFKSKHKLDLALVSMDQRGKMLLGYSDAELANMGGYDLVHFDDLAYVASAHQELLKTGASGMIAYRLQTKDGQWQWLQTSSRLVYKNSKPDFVISTHRPLMEEEGRDLLGKRTMDFKVSYLDAGLTNSYFSDSDVLLGPTSGPGSTAPSHLSPGGGLQGAGAAQPQRLNRRYKTQLRDFLSTCRTKRKLASHHAGNAAAAAAVTVAGAATSAVDYLPDTSAAAAVAAAYNMYSAQYPATPSADNVYMGHSGNFHQSLYDNRFLTTPENLFHQYRPLGSYYTEYHHQPYVGNGVGVGVGYLPTYETSMPIKTDCDKLYCQEQKYSPCSDYPVSVCDVQHKKLKSDDSASSPNGLVTPKMEDVKADVNMLHYGAAEAPRQTVLMWGSTALDHTPASSGGRSPSPSGHHYKKFSPADPLKSLAEMNSMSEPKWKPETPPSPKSYYQHLQYEGGHPPESGIISPRLLQLCGSGRRRSVAVSAGGPDKQDRSPLLSISEVTNTLLNQ